MKKFPLSLSLYCSQSSFLLVMTDFIRQEEYDDKLVRPTGRPQELENLPAIIPTLRLNQTPMKKPLEGHKNL
jgi:hypothetical protein